MTHVRSIEAEFLSVNLRIGLSKTSSGDLAASEVNRRHHTRRWWLHPAVRAEALSWIHPDSNPASATC